MVELKNVSFGYNPNKNVIEDLSLNLEEGRFYGLLGKNGTGKTTLMKIISGILFSKEGYVNIEGNNPRDRKLETLQEIFMMPADFTFPKMSLEKYALSIHHFILNSIKTSLMTVSITLK
ncbi:ATP-binding cassette domain-containing protein [Bacteroides sp. ET336]|uniref:ATP-binding cassette domain-containing protein n=1 Tax=Bacteroides sp. ET336 TaxID=2972459 RepID=UPI0021AC59DE|nr:ATP-binding cassette domain-containing protein [Bacteroides sp. ET336]MCR8892711.1 ATP-binding cassette domain-containing protein [Bacteroides sp. ET336]MDN0057208.1 ATP-binding cassette domain-containing protein [Bacteroides caecigallinarum]